MKRKRKNRWPLVYGILLTCYMVFTLLDAFVIPRDRVLLTERMTQTDRENTKEQTNNDGEPDSVSEDTDEQSDDEGTDETRTATDNNQAEPVITENSYESNTISISIQTMEAYDTQIYVADVILSDASYLRTALAGGAFGRNISETTSSMAQDNNAILAINGDYYGFRDQGFVMREGYLYRDTRQRGEGYEDLVIYEDGNLAVVDESEIEASELEEAGAVQIFSFGPGLIRDGEITVDEGSEVEQAMQSNPRTAIGQIEPLHYVFVVSDGRTEESAGLTLLELAQVMSDLSCQTAYNLDGGGSSTMYFRGEIVNHPTNGWRSGERSISDIIYVGE